MKQQHVVAKERVRRQWVRMLFSQGRRYYHAPLLAYCLPYVVQGGKQRVVIISKRRVKQAVMRHKVQRRILVAHRKQLCAWPAFAQVWGIGYIYQGATREHMRYAVIDRAVAQIIRVLRHA